MCPQRSLKRSILQHRHGFMRTSPHEHLNHRVSGKPGAVQNAQQATSSQDKTIASAGRQILDMIRDVEASDQTVTIEARDLSKINGFGARTDTTGWGIIIDGKDPRIDPTVLLAHELGHAYFTLIDSKKTWFLNWSRSVQYENDARAILGCSRRIMGLDMLYVPACK